MAQSDIATALAPCCSECLFPLSAPTVASVIRETPYEALVAGETRTAW